MKNALFVSFAISLLAFPGCGKQDYSDPQAFMDHYAPELIAKRLGAEKEILGFDGFKFSKLKIGIDQFKGEFVSAQLAVVPKRGMKYHQLADPKLRRVDCSLPDDWQHKYIKEHTMDMLRRLGERLNEGEYCPMIYNPEVLDTTALFGNLGRVRIYRDKDSSGILRPISGSEALIFYESWNEDSGNPHLNSNCSRPRCKFSSKTIGSEDYLKKRKAMAYSPSDTQIPANVKKTIDDYNTHVANMTNAYLAIRNTVKHLTELEDRNSSRPNDDSYWVARKVREDREAANAAYKEAVRIARRDFDKAMEEAKAYEGDIVCINRALQKEIKKLESAKSSYEATRQRYEARLAKQKGRRDRQLETAEDQLSSKEAQVAKCREKVEELEKQLLDAKANLAAENAKARELEPIVKEQIAKAKAVLEEATAGLEEKWRARHKEELASTKARLDRSIETILSEVEAMSKAVGKDK